MKKSDTNKTQVAVYLDDDNKEKLEEIQTFSKKLGNKESYGEIVSRGLDIIHDKIAAEYFEEYEEEYPRWQKRWNK